MYDTVLGFSFKCGNFSPLITEGFNKGIWVFKALEPGAPIRWSLFSVETFGLSLVIEIHIPLIWTWLSRILTDMQCPLTAHEATLVKKHAHSLWHRACIASIIDSRCFLRILQPWVQSITKCYFCPALLIRVQTAMQRRKDNAHFQQISSEVSLLGSLLNKDQFSLTFCPASSWDGIRLQLMIHYRFKSKCSINPSEGSSLIIVTPARKSRCGSRPVRKGCSPGMF